MFFASLQVENNIKDRTIFLTSHDYCPICKKFYGEDLRPMFYVDPFYVCKEHTDEEIFKLEIYILLSDMGYSMYS